MLALKREIPEFDGPQRTCGGDVWLSPRPPAPSLINKTIAVRNRSSALGWAVHTPPWIQGDSRPPTRASGPCVRPRAGGAWLTPGAARAGAAAGGWGLPGAGEASLAPGGRHLPAGQPPQHFLIPAQTTTAARPPWQQTPPPNHVTLTSLRAGAQRAATMTTGPAPLAARDADVALRLGAACAAGGRGAG